MGAKPQRGSGEPSPMIETKMQKAVPKGFSTPRAHHDAEGSPLGPSGRITVMAILNAEVGWFRLRVSAIPRMG